MRHQQHHVPQKPLTKLEWAVTVFGSIDPIVAFPQAIKIWQLQSAHEIFLPSWIFSTFVAALWMYYGIRLKKNPIIITSALWVITDVAVATGAVLYG